MIEVPYLFNISNVETGKRLQLHTTGQALGAGYEFLPWLDQSEEYWNSAFRITRYIDLNNLAYMLPRTMVKLGINVPYIREVLDVLISFFTDDEEIMRQHEFIDAVVSDIQLIWYGNETIEPVTNGDGDILVGIIKYLKDYIKPDYDEVYLGWSTDLTLVLGKMEGIINADSH